MTAVLTSPPIPALADADLNDSERSTLHTARANPGDRLLQRPAIDVLLMVFRETDPDGPPSMDPDALPGHALAGWLWPWLDRETRHDLVLRALTADTVRVVAEDARDNTVSAARISDAWDRIWDASEALDRVAEAVSRRHVIADAA